MTLPQGWVNSALTDVCELLNGRAYKQTELLERGKWPVLRVGNFFSNPKWYYSDLDLDENKYCDNGDLLYAWSASFGPKIWDGGKVIYHYHIWKTQPNYEILDQNYLFHWFDWDTNNIKADHGTGTTMIHVTKGDMEQRSIPIPPLAEQRRIVAELNTLSGRLGRARAELDRVPVLASKLRQAALDDVFANPAFGEQVTLSELGKWSSGGTPKSSEPSYYGGDIPWIRSGDLPDGPVNEHFVTITDEGLRASSAKWVEEGAVLIAMYGATIGKLGITTYPVTTNQAIACIVPGENVDTLWLFYLLLKKRPELIALGQGGAQPNISQQILKAIVTSRPSLAHQRQVAAAINGAFTRAERLEAEAVRARALLDRLESAILAKAFVGELVPQDPNDEPAGALLERIRAEQQAQPRKFRLRRATNLVETDQEGRPMAAKSLPARDQLLSDSESWPAEGLAYEEVAKRVLLPHDEMRDALFGLLSGPEPALRQRFDTAGERMILQRIAA